jgi:hypothetical protein
MGRLLIGDGGPAVELVNSPSWHAQRQGFASSSSSSSSSSG